MDHYNVFFCRRAFPLAIKLLCLFPVNCLSLRLKILLECITLENVISGYD